MSQPSFQQRLLDTMANWEIIDCHEHLPEERQRTGSPVDALTLFSHYTQNDLKTAGMSEQDYQQLSNHDIPLPRRWALVKPYWERIRYTGYARAVLLAVRRFYGCDDLNDQTYQLVSERMQATNTEGLYDRVLRQACHIRVALTQIGRLPEANRDLLIPLLPAASFAALPGDKELTELARAGDQPNLDNYLQAIRRRLQEAKGQGMIGLKITSHALGQPTREEAETAFERAAERREYDRAALSEFLLHQVFEMAADENLVVAVHCGLVWNNWNAFAASHPRHVVPLLLAHRRTRFDLYHAGIPWVREMGVIGKTFPNVWLNLCWTHIISPAMTVSAVNEWLELLPYTKILGFGGDYARPVEKVYGHLQLALEDIATILAGRVEAGWMSEDQALTVAHAWLWDNPVELYRLAV